MRNHQNRFAKLESKENVIYDIIGCTTYKYISNMFKGYRRVFEGFKYIILGLIMYAAM